MSKDRFSITPPTAPAKPYEVANKQYVDDIRDYIMTLLGVLPYIITISGEQVISNADEDIVGLA